MGRELHLREVTMRVEYGRCCGLDVHKATGVAWVIVPLAARTRLFANGVSRQKLRAATVRVSTHA